MKFIPECISCYMDDMLGAITMLGLQPAQTKPIMQEILLYLSEHIGEEVPPSYHITAMHRILKKHIQQPMPFSAERDLCMKAGKHMAQVVEKQAMYLSEFDKFKLYVQWAIASNSLDFRTAGTGYALTSFDIEKTMQTYFDTGLALDESAEIYKIVKGAKRIVYIPDNVGELPFDKLLLSQLRSFGASITIPFRGGPITSDAVLSDAESAGIADVVDLVILSGADTLGISFAEMSDDLRLALSRADVIIAKGQANYYVLSEYCDAYPDATIICLFTAKCRHIWTLFGCSSKSSIAAIINKPSLTKVIHEKV